MSDRPRMLIYGANGYTGRLIVEHVVSMGMKSITVIILFASVSKT